MTTIHTFGDSILDCGVYNPHGITPGQLIARNNDALFPEFRARDLASRGRKPVVRHHARDGATVNSLHAQLANLAASPGDVAMLTIGGNDLLQGIATDRSGRAVRAFEKTLRSFLDLLPIRPVFIGNVYDPTFGRDDHELRRRLAMVRGVEIDPALARSNQAQVNAVLAKMAGEVGYLVDLHSHFLSGDASFFTMIIEPSLTGASEVRRAFLAAMENAGV